MRHSRFKSQLLFQYKFVSGTYYFPISDLHVRFSSSTRRSMNTVCDKPNCSDFFSHTVPRMERHHRPDLLFFLPPSEFCTLIICCITRY
ncbi:hypothetical protein CRE_19951 [Caenorhabditis remanei]|uniref:Uncharacterized protein n=1 Tax=Caenorhabditis remanei TaxID=31234 RepID=E3N8H4_CAERE|nr:hypothetical protein CRE_19951 [Caenorhabditis remanei]